MKPNRYHPSLLFRAGTAALLATLGLVLPSLAVTYLKASATGAGSGVSWADACTNVAGAVTVAAAGDKLIYAAGGIYVIPATIQPADGLSIYGGFPGLSMDETPEDRDADAHQTIFTGDQALNDIWIHVEPVLGVYTLTETAIPQRVLTNGVVNLPGPFTGDYDGFWPSIAGPNTQRAFSIAAGVGIAMDGLWFTGFYGQTGTCIELNSGAKSSSFTDCRFVGNYPNLGNICDEANSVDTFITRCQFLFNRTSQRGSAFASRGRTFASRCTFVSCSRSVNNGGNVIFFWGGSNIDTAHSTFTRCIDLANAEWQETAYSGSGNIVASEGGTGNFINCVFTNNLSMSPFTYGSPVFAIRAGIVRHCLVANNRYEVKPRADRSYALFGNTQADFNSLIEGCTFTNNTVAAPAVVATSGTYALGILGHGANNARYAVLNCTFDGNRAEAAPVAGVTPLLSRALVSTAGFYGNAAQMGVANCTFSGPAATGRYEIVQFGDYHTRPLTVLNSLFTRAGDACEPFYAANPAQFIVRDCSVKNLRFPPDWLDAAGIESDDTALAPLAVLPPGTVPVRQVVVRMPGIRETADVATNQPTAFPPLFRYRLRGASAWTPLLPAANSGLDGSTPRPIPDACGNDRVFGTYTRGAVQPLANAAETGVSLVLRADPPSGGTFSAPGHAQAVATNAAITPVTALPAAGASFLGWYDETNALYSSAATLAIASLGEDTLLTARFGTPEVTLTFDLGTYGTFVANGLATLATNVPAGTAFPGAPAFTADPAWFVEGWSPALPVATPWTNAAYTAQAVSSSLRILHVVPSAEVPGGSDGTGSSWANARGDFAAAYADAGRYRGEVWLRQGRHLLTTPVTLLPNVTVRGGFDGTETDAAQADPTSRLSILSGDVNNDTYWQPYGADPGAANRTNIWSGTAFNRPNPGGGADYWAPGGNSGDDTAIGFSDFAGGITNAGFDGVVLTCFRVSGLVIGTGSDVVLARGRVYACNTGKNSGNSALDCGGAILLEDSELIGNWRALNLSGAALTVSNIVRTCLFEENSANWYGACIRMSSTTPTLVEGCRFYRNAGLSEAYRCSSTITFNGAGRGWVGDCRFEENRVRVNCHGNVIIEGNGTFVFARCAFLRNTLVPNSDRTYHSAGLMVMNGNTLIRDSLFEANLCSVDQSSTEARAWGSVYCGTGGNTTFLNTTFRNNSAAATGTGNAFCGTFASIGTGPNYAMVHCTVDGSLLNEKSREFINSGANNGTTFAIVDSAVRSADPAYAPFNVPAAVTLCLAESSITGIDTNTLATGSNGYLYNVTAADARLAGYPTPVADGVSALGVSGASPFARAGRPVWLATDDYLYLHDPVGKPATPWRRIVSKGTAYATVAGLALDSAPVPDALGAPRLANRIAYGPLNAPPPGTLILLR